ncbi:MAG: hypothetical protein AAF492_23240, partial [Verrucomicrobiota bacterium]
EPTVNLDLGPTNLTYTINFINTSISPLGGVVVTDTLPDEVMFVSSMPPASLTNGNDYTFNLGALEAGSNASITIDVIVTSTVPGVVTNVAIAGFTNTNVTISSAQDMARTLLFRPTDLALTKEVSRVQSNYSYLISITNRSVSLADNVVVVDTLPAGAVLNTSSPFPGLIVGDDLTYNLGLLPSGASTAITLSITYTSTSPAVLTNVAVVTSTTAEDNLTNNRALALAPTASTNVEVILTKTVNPVNMTLGMSNLSYSITVVNISTVFAGTIVITDSLPLSVQYLTSSIPASQTNGNHYAFRMRFFGAGSSTTLVINAAYTGSVPAVLTNWATVYTTNLEASLANNTDVALTVVTGVPPCVPGIDTDGDGMEDCDERCAGTDPLDPGDLLWVRIDPTGTQTVHRVTFPTVLGRTYRLENNTDLFSNGWKTILSNLPGLGIDRSVLQTSTTERTYYRIGVAAP